jgi:hypothetical protein
MRKISTQQVCEMARALDGVSEKDHFGSDAFVANGRIFATVWHNKNEVNLMLNEEQQRSFLVRDESEGFYTLDNAWGKNAINVQLAEVDPRVFAEALKVAWVNSANKRTMGTSKKKKPAKKKVARKRKS